VDKLRKIIYQIKEMRKINRKAKLVAPQDENPAEYPVEPPDENLDEYNGLDYMVSGKAFGYSREAAEAAEEMF
jgi:hypothetical protein